MAQDNYSRTTKMHFRINSLYEICPKMLHGMKVIILVGKKRKRGGLAGIQTHDLHPSY
jgi:hypothetical protein